MNEIVPIARAIVHHDGEILVLQNRTDHENASEQNKWEIPGGFVDAHDETETDALVREIREETGVEPVIEQQLQRVMVVEDETNFDCQYYLAAADTRDVTLSEEHQDYQWIPPEQFKELDWSVHAGYTIPVIQQVREDIEN